MTAPPYDRAKLISSFEALLDARERFDEAHRDGLATKFADPEGRIGAHQIYGDGAYLFGEAIGPLVQQVALNDDAMSTRDRLRDLLWHMSPLAQATPTENLARTLEDALAGLEYGHIAEVVRPHTRRGRSSQQYPRLKLQRLALWWVHFELGYWRKIKSSNITSIEQIIADLFGVSASSIAEWRKACDGAFGSSSMAFELRGASLAGQGLVTGIRPDGRRLGSFNRSTIDSELKADGDAYKALVKSK